MQRSDIQILEWSKRSQWFGLTLDAVRLLDCWGTCWLYHKARKGKLVSDTSNPPHMVRF